MSSLALSVLLSLVSAVAYAAGAIVQERVATTGDGHSLAPLRNRVWWAAVALNGGARCSMSWRWPTVRSVSSSRSVR